jgi:hypothetical protein
MFLKLWIGLLRESRRLIFYKTKSDSSIGASVHKAIQAGIEIGE